MKLRVSLTAFRASLFGTLGLAAGAACGDGTPRVGDVTFHCTPARSGDVAPDDGFELCEEGYYHRVERLACAVRVSSAACAGDPGPDSECATDGDCAAGAYCLRSNNPLEPIEGTARCYCQESCQTDSDCGPGGVCDCQLTTDDAGHSYYPAGSCKSGDISCSVDADCGPGGLCASYTTSSCGGRSFACLSIDDECVSDDDCRGSGSSRSYCGFDGKHRACMEPDCVVGRPFRVENEDRLAPLAARGDWALRPEALDASALPEALRAELGAYWARLGQMEHASVAAFARFALQLLALGAPPALVADAQAAMGDELEHARLCFGLASTLSGRAVGPGPLALEGALEGASLGEVVRLAVVEGCVGETLAALEAAESYEVATDASVREVLGRVRADEGRHAELAWRFVAWALEVGGEAAREAAASAFAQAFDEASGPGGSAGEPGEADAQALAFGRLPERLRRELRRQALREVVGPCAERMLAAPSVAKAAAPGDASSARALVVDRHRRGVAREATSAYERRRRAAARRAAKAGGGAEGDEAAG